MMITVYFTGQPGGPHDRAATHIFENHGGEHIGSGNMMIGPRAGERDVQYEVPDDRAEACRTVLRNAGFRFEPTPLLDKGAVE